MKYLSMGDNAPDFSLPDHQGIIHTLSELYKTINVLLVFNIGFA